MKFKSFLIILSTFFLITGCEKEIIPEEEKEKEEEEKYVPAPYVDGRVALGYVTYYGTKVPDPTLLTHLNYAFAELYVVDGVYKGFKVQGKEDRFKSMLSLKRKNKNLKILISFTHGVVNSGNSQGGGFSAMSSTPEGRIAFANDCKKFLETWLIDGVDIDWEYPGISWSGHASDQAHDTDNYVLLMKQLRETLGEKYLLTYAGYVRDKVATKDGWKYIDIKAVDQYVDFVNIMTYDLDSAPRHHSALKDSRAYWDCNRAVKAYIDAGISPSKLVLGIPFYGRRSFSSSPGAFKYKSIMEFDPKIYKVDNWDSYASVPYVTLVKDNSFYCGYDNPQSIETKWKWASSQGLKGMMFWEYEQDDDEGTLRKAIWESVMKQ